MIRGEKFDCVPTVAALLTIIAIVPGPAVLGIARGMKAMLSLLLF